MTHFLITNDDGIDAPGLAAMEAMLSQFVGNADRVTIAAPNRGYSGCGHVTSNYEPLKVEAIAPQRYRVFGSPADCARLGVLELAQGVDVVLSGINLGANAGVDLWMSGTVAAVREAGWLGVPGIAISQYVHGNAPRDWQRTAALAARALATVFSQGVHQLGNAYWNINLPDVATPVDQVGIQETFVEPAHYPVSFQKTPEGDFQFCGDYQGRPRTAGSDVAACFGGDISISEIAWLKPGLATPTI